MNWNKIRVSISSIPFSDEKKQKITNELLDAELQNSSLDLMIFILKKKAFHSTHFYGLAMNQLHHFFAFYVMMLQLSKGNAMPPSKLTKVHDVHDVHLGFKEQNSI